MKRFGLFAVVCAAVLGLTSSAAAQAQQKVRSAADQTLTGLTDDKFVEKVSASDMAEIAMGKMAAEHATNPAVKRFAQQLVDDHTKSSQSLKAIADKKGMPLARTPDEKHRAHSDKIVKLKGADFDRAFAQHMVEDHRQAIELFTAEAKNGKDADLRAFAEKTLPTLREHLKTAASLAGGAGTGGTGTRQR